MKDWLSYPRGRQIAALATATLVAVLLAFVALRPTPTADQRSEIGEAVEPDFGEYMPDLGLIMVTTSDESYHLVRNPDGWVLTEKGGYPVAEARITQLAEAVATMRYDQAMTRDDRKFDLLGLGDPLTGGTGALLELGNGRGDVFAKMIVGYRSGRSYVRAPDDLQAWAVEVDAMPPLQRATAWLDLDPAGIKREEIRQVTVQPVVGASYTLRAADEAGGAFVIAPPFEGLRVLVPFSLSIVGGAAASLKPVDVAPTAVRAGANMSGVHTTTLRSGLIMEATAWRMADRGWVTLVARTEPGASSATVQRATRINTAAGEWAYALTEADWEAFTSPLALLANEG